MTGTSTTRHDDRRARAVPALRAELEAQHEHEGDLSHPEISNFRM
jgi:hypothetical protein